jgi:hypothetical protein
MQRTCWTAGSKPDEVGCGVICRNNRSGCLSRSGKDGQAWN